jgi:hypothetical protein
MSSIENINLKEENAALKRRIASLEETVINLSKKKRSENRCKECNDKVDWEHAVERTSCDLCHETVCSDCLERCKHCEAGSYMCSSCVEVCTECKMRHCGAVCHPEIKKWCEKCERTFCGDCPYECEVCKKVKCLDCGNPFDCAECGLQCCEECADDEHPKVCLDCGKEIKENEDWEKSIKTPP